MAAGSDGMIYICEALADRISVFDRNGAPVRRWGIRGHAPGELRAPGGIAVSPDGRIYVSDTGNDRIEVFSALGVFERAWGETGTGSGELNEPLGLAVDARRVYVADSKNDRIQVFDREGRFLLYVWNYGLKNGQFDRPVDVAAAPDGSFFVSDQGNSRIQQFDANGQFVRAWGGWGPHPGLFAEPGGIDLHGDRLYVADTHNHRVQVLDLEGTPFGEWPASALDPGGSGGVVAFPTDVAALPDSGAIVCDALSDRCRILRDRVGEPGTGGAAIAAITAITAMTTSARAMGGDGDTLVVSAGSGSLLVLDLSRDLPEPAAVLGRHGREALEFVRPEGVAFDTDRDTIIVSDGGNSRLAEFGLKRTEGDRAVFDSLRTRFLRSIYLSDEEAILLWPRHWPLAPPLLRPGRVVRDARGTLFLIDELFSRIVMFDRTLRPTGSWGQRGDGDGSFQRPRDLALDRASETLYVLDSERARVQAFDRTGRFRFAWGRSGPDRSELVLPIAIATARDGSVFVADRGACRILRFSSLGEFQDAWGAKGTERGTLDKPDGLFVDAKGRVLVRDSGGRRLQAFTAEGRLLWDLDLESAAAAARERALRTTSPSVLPTDPPTDTASLHGDAPECPHRLDSNDHGYVVCYRMMPERVPLNESFSMDVRVYDAGSPPSGSPSSYPLAEMVALNVEAVMPAHGHGMIELPQIKALGAPIPRERLPDHSAAHGVVGNGRFQVSGMRFHMPGRWEVEFDIGRGALTERAQMEVDVD